MHIDKYKKGGEYEMNGISYTDATELLCGTFMLDFCGCGRPSSALEYVQKTLQLLKDREHQTYEQMVEAEKRMFSDDGAMYFMWYWLDNKELTEHGGSVPGWLTEKGEQMLEDLTELLPILAEE